MVTFKSLDIVGVAMYPPHYLKKSLDFLSQHMDRFPYAQMCDATFPLTKAAEAMEKSERREVTRAGLLPRRELKPAARIVGIGNQGLARHQLGLIATRNLPEEMRSGIAGEVALADDDPMRASARAGLAPCVCGFGTLPTSAMTGFPSIVSHPVSSAMMEN